MPFKKGRERTGGRKKTTEYRALNQLTPAERKRQEQGLRDLALAHAADIVQRLLDLASQDDFPAVAANACQQLLDRGLGKPVQPSELKVEIDKREVVWKWTPELLQQMTRLGLVYTNLGPYSSPSIAETNGSPPSSPIDDVEKPSPASTN